MNEQVVLVRSLRLLATLLLLFSVLSYASAAGIHLFVGMNQVPILPQPIVSGEGVLIPADVIGELGGQIEQISSSFVNFCSDQRTIAVEAGKESASVDGTAVDMGVSALSQQDVLYVPLGFVADVLDLQVEWEQDNAAIRLLQETMPDVKPLATFTGAPKATESVSHSWEGIDGSQLGGQAWIEAGQSVVELKGIDTDSVETWLLTTPDRLVIDTDAFMPARIFKPWVLDHPVVRQVRVAPFKGKGRVVLDLNQSIGYAVEACASGIRIRVNRALHAVGFTPSPGGGSLLLHVPEETPYRLMRLPAPDRIVIDLQGTTLVGGARSIETDGGILSAVRVSQFDQHVVRVVLDVIGDLPGLPFRVPGSQLEFGLRPEIRAISMADLGDGRSVVMVEGIGPLEGKILRLSDPERVVLDIPNAWPTASFGTVGGAPLIKELRAAQFTPQVFRVVTELTGKATVRFARLGESKLAIVVEPPSLVGARIAVDAGHGGMDPGAIGREQGLREAEINLDIANRLLTLLEEAGADPLMVRPDESYVFLLDRPRLAEQHKSDVMISIHCNSAGHNEASGTETIFCDCGNGSLELAREIQTELVAMLGTKDRGVKQGQLLVLRESTAPAVLVEVAFLSHADEEAKLATEEFRQLAAQGIFNGIFRYVGDSGTLLSPEDSEELREVVEQAPKRVYMPRSGGGGVSDVIATLTKSMVLM